MIWTKDCSPLHGLRRLFRGWSCRNAHALKSCLMDDKYNVRKSRKPGTKQEAIQQEIEELIKRRDSISNLAEKQAIQKQIMKLFAQYERLKL